MLNMIKDDDMIKEIIAKKKVKIIKSVLIIAGLVYSYYLLG